MQRRPLIPVRLVNRNLSIFQVQQRPRYRRIRVPRSDVQRRDTIREAQLRALLDQEQRRRRIAIAPENPPEKSLQIGGFESLVLVAAESRQRLQAIRRHEFRPVAPEQAFDWQVRQSLGRRLQPEPAAHRRIQRLVASAEPNQRQGMLLPVGPPGRGLQRRRPREVSDVRIGPILQQRFENPDVRIPHRMVERGPAVSIPGRQVGPAVQERPDAVRIRLRHPRRIQQLAGTSLPVGRRGRANADREPDSRRTRPTGKAGKSPRHRERGL